MQIRLSDHFTYRRLFRFVLPTVVMMIVTSVYSIVDGFFVSNFVGKNPFAALNLIFPVLMAMGAIGFMIGTGGSALVAKTLGEGDRDRANRYFSMLIYVLIAIGILLSTAGFIAMRPLASLLGASDLIIDDCVLYGRTLAVGNTLFMLQNSFVNFLVAAERPKLGLWITVLAGVSNMILDFVLICVFPLGLFGAALATVIGQAIGALVPLIYFLRKNSSLLKLVRARVEWRALGKACVNGSSEMLTNLAASFIGMLYNFQLIKLAAEDGLAAYGVIMYVSFIFMAIFFGYAVGSAPLISYHYGAANTNELKNLFRKSLLLTGAVAVVMTALCLSLAVPLAKIFVGYDAALTEMTAEGLRIYSLAFLLCGFNIFGSAFFTALNNGLLSALISFLRILVFETIAILLLPTILGLTGVWLAISVAEILALAVTVTLFIINRGKYHYA